MLASLLAAAALPALDVAVVAGHSLGELTALVHAGVLDLDDGLRVVGARGDAMQAAADAAPGTMAAVLGLDAEAVARVCAGLEGVWPANDNAPAHVVVSGTAEGVAAAGRRSRRRAPGGCWPLPVGGAFHTPLMAPARERLDARCASVPHGRAASRCCRRWTRARTARRRAACCRAS